MSSSCEWLIRLAGIPTPSCNSVVGMCMAWEPRNEHRVHDRTWTASAFINARYRLQRLHAFADKLSKAFSIIVGSLLPRASGLHLAQNYFLHVRTQLTSDAQYPCNPGSNPRCVTGVRRKINIQLPSLVKREPETTLSLSTPGGPLRSRGRATLPKLPVVKKSRRREWQSRPRATFQLQHFTERTGGLMHTAVEWKTMLEVDVEPLVFPRVSTTGPEAVYEDVPCGYGRLWAHGA